MAGKLDPVGRPSFLGFSADSTRASLGRAGHGRRCGGPPVPREVSRCAPESVPAGRWPAGSCCCRRWCCWSSSGSALVALLWETDSDTERATAARVTSIAQSVAAAPDVVRAVTASLPCGAGDLGAVGGDGAGTPRPSGRRPAPTSWWSCDRTGSATRTPIRTQIGQQYRGTRDAALAGGIGVETYTGTLGPSMRADRPGDRRTARSSRWSSVGVTVDNINAGHQGAAGRAGAHRARRPGGRGDRFADRSPVGAPADAGHGPAELARMFTYYDAVLASVHEGMVLLDGDGRIVSVNTEGRRLLGLTDEAIGAQRRAGRVADPDRRADRHSGRPHRRTGAAPTTGCC